MTQLIQVLEKTVSPGNFAFFFSLLPIIVCVRWLAALRCDIFFLLFEKCYRANEIMANCKHAHFQASRKLQYFNGILITPENVLHIFVLKNWKKKTITNS